MKKLIAAISFLIVVLLVPACGNKEIALEHIHGIGYSSNGKQILIPAHNGLVAYSEGKWKNVEVPKHDYMGFINVDNGFYSSGHPVAGSNLKNPLGIVKSEDLGKTLSRLGLEGESDFHGMTVGFKSHSIYVFNAQPNSKMNSAGLFYSTDDAKTWNKSAAVGLSGEPIALSAHPMDAKTIAIGTKAGLLISTDSGNRFETLLPQIIVSAVYFSKNGDLFVASPQSSTLKQINLETKATKEVNLPSLDKDDAVSYIAQNPATDSEITIATFKKDIYISKDTGTNWIKIVDKGKSK
ncbi:F510_1955 family glycosylhydrolase [Paenibacillus alginolyticus]|uniref:Glycosyl hydrolase n=1 Tax=Paenibacillus alginolyticus TaxID=59839 RepID=A0ABT4G9W0_9BACL|nr:hypothetical protein [Paenibacillus alginolyticus]MCY9692952.1 hypothetical protein [Paenibacillus alginolyticus]MEC0144624.1 hypothetical protein [Paenibacillus alginolyticus]